jgi:hypothetical protein
VVGRGRAPDLVLALPMQAGKGYSVTLPGAPRPAAALLRCSRKRAVAVTPMDGALRVGGTLELTRHRHARRREARCAGS